MKDKAIIHLMTKSRMRSQAFKADIDAMEELSEKYGVKSIIFYKWDEIDYIDMISKLEKFGIFTKNYANRDDLLEKVADFTEDYEIIFVYTAMELLIKIANRVKEKLWQIISEERNIFRDKSLQRQLIADNNPELGIKFLKWEPENLDIKEIEEKIGYPFIIKPVDWVQSSWVQKIEKRADFKKYMSNYEAFHEKLKARWVDSKELIVEEFLDGNLYTLDYYVDKDWYVYNSKPAREILWIDFWIPDYCVVARMSSLDIELQLKWIRLKTFINSTVKACGIKNTFVHHEFKYTSKKKLKTIELNGRLWWGRVALMKKAYDINLFEMIINPNLKAGKIKENSIVFIIHAPKRWILKAFNNKTLANINRRESVYSIKLDESKLGKETWLTKDWFTKLWEIKLANTDYNQIFKDYNYIKSKYKNILIIESKEKESFITKFKYYLWN